MVLTTTRDRRARWLVDWAFVFGGKYALRKVCLPSSRVDITMVLAKNQLKSFRDARGLTQEKLAEQVLVSRQTIISIEGGRYVPSLELALKLGRTFNCQVEDLFGIEEEPHVRKA